MKNFETAQILIEELQIENEKLKQKLAQLSECKVDIQVDSGHRISRMIREKDAAMARFTEKIRNKAKKNKGTSNG